jgi:hypothetical protein
METPVPFCKRLLWMATIWTASVLAMGLVASLIRIWLQA